jgi:uncharacterized repeat protein (TIGR03943 family)
VLTGFVVHQGGQLKLARLVITCCAADASPLTVTLVGEYAQDVARLPNNQWISLTGQWHPSAGDAQAAPQFTVQSATTIATPKDPYEY